MGGSIASGSSAVEVELGVTGVPMVNEVYGRPCREWGWDTIFRLEDAVKLMR